MSLRFLRTIVTPSYIILNDGWDGLFVKAYPSNPPYLLRYLVHLLEYTYVCVDVCYHV